MLYRIIVWEVCLFMSVFFSFWIRVLWCFNADVMYRNNYPAFTNDKIHDSFIHTWVPHHCLELGHWKPNTMFLVTASIAERNVWSNFISRARNIRNFACACLNVSFFNESNFLHDFMKKCLFLSFVHENRDFFYAPCIGIGRGPSPPPSLSPTFV